MNRRNLAVIVILLSQLLGVVARAAETSSWWDESPWQDPDRGFNWYPPDEPPKKKAPPKKEKPKPIPIQEMKTLPEVKKEANRLRDIAIMQPTPENVYAYLAANKYMMDKSAMFADVSQRVVWQNPDIDYNTRSPQANFAQLEMTRIQDRAEDELMAQLAKTHGIIFFYRADCEFCHMQAPIMTMLRDRHKIEVLAVSGDGGPIEGFPDAKPDNGIGMLVTSGRGIPQYPATYLVSRDQSQIVQLGSGVLAMDEIVRRVRVLVTTKPGERF